MGGYGVIDDDGRKCVWIYKYLILAIDEQRLGDVQCAVTLRASKTAADTSVVDFIVSVEDMNKVIYRQYPMLL